MSGAERDAMAALAAIEKALPTLAGLVESQLSALARERDDARAELASARAERDDARAALARMTEAHHTAMVELGRVYSGGIWWNVSQAAAALTPAPCPACGGQIHRVADGERRWLECTHGCGFSTEHRDRALEDR